MKRGKVYLVGAGPGDAGLITVRGAELLGRADVIVYDRLASPRLLRHARRGAELIYVGKEAASEASGQERINRLLVEHAVAGKTVVRLKGGDPLIFGRGGEEALALAAAKVDFEIVPGVTAVSAAAACAGIPVTHRGLASCLGLVTGHESLDKAGGGLDWSALAAWPGTLAFYMAVANLEAIGRRLTAGGMAGATPAAVVRWAGTAAQQVLTGTLADIAEKARQANLEPPAIVLVGKVVSLRESLEWFQRRPLFGQRIAVTRAADQAGELAQRLEELGAAVTECPVITIQPPADLSPLRQAVANLRAFDWIVFASVHAVEAFFAALTEAGGDGRSLAACRLCCVGPATAARLGQFGLHADLQPEAYNTDNLIEALARATDVRGLRILCPRSDVAPPELLDALAARGAGVTPVVAYRTQVDKAGAECLARLVKEGNVDWITFTSSSTVRGLLSAVEPEAMRHQSVRLASIGPATSATLRRAGLEPAVEAAEHTMVGLVDAMIAACRGREVRE
jgi:uroporphyrinogen III methyltransferase/synthase